MLLPRIFKSEDFELLKEIIEENSFSNLIINKDRIISTKAMMLVNGIEKDNFFIETHLHRANPVARNIKKVAQEVLCDFTGAHAYISSSWYDHINVSTWNYEAVQIYGNVEIMSDDELYNHVKKLTDKYEPSQKCPMTVEKMGKEYVEKEMKGAIGIKIIPAEIKIKQKLSQNKNETNLINIINNLVESDYHMDKIMAQKMKKQLYIKHS
jgi:transcriptional regulator